MAEKLDPRQLVTFEELLRAMMFETEAKRGGSCSVRGIRRFLSNSSYAE